MKKQQHFSYCLASTISLFTFAVYIASLFNGFVYWDDDVYVLNNTYIRSFNGDLLRFAFLEFYSYNWHPLTWISHSLDYAIWGVNPFGHHLTNIIIHGANTFFVVILVIKLFDATKGKNSDKKPILFQDDRAKYITGGVAGILFGIHPLHVESVAWIAERKDLLCSLFFLLSLLFYVNYVKRTIKKENSVVDSWISRKKDYFFSLGFFVMALLSKPMAVSLPVVLIILDWYPFNRCKTFRSFLKTAAEKIPFVCMSIGSSIVTILAQKSGEAVWEAIAFPVRILVAAMSLFNYLKNIIWPVNLLPFYPHPQTAQLFSVDYLVPVVLLIGITAIFIVKAREQKFWLSVWMYYVATLIPVLGIIQVGGQSMADRYMYLPSIGPFVIIGIVIAWILEKVDVFGKRRLSVQVVSLSIALFTLVSLSYITVRQIKIWNNPISLWNHVIEKEPENILIAYYNRGHAYARMGQYQSAIEDYSKVIRNNYKEYSKVYIDRGLTYLKVGQVEPALLDLQKACDLGDSFGCKALRYMPMQRR